MEKLRTLVLPLVSVRFTYRKWPSGENTIPSRPCSEPDETWPVRSRTGRLRTFPSWIATTRPVFSATYRSGSPARTAMATGCSSVATGASRTLTSARRPTGEAELDGEAELADGLGPAVGEEVDVEVHAAAMHTNADTRIVTGRTRMGSTVPALGTILRRCGS